MLFLLLRFPSSACPPCKIFSDGRADNSDELTSDNSMMSQTTEEGWPDENDTAVEQSVDGARYNYDCLLTSEDFLIDLETLKFADLYGSISDPYFCCYDFYT